MKQSVISIVLILVGFFALMLSVFIGGGLIILGIVMLVERRWPEKLKDE